MAGRLGDRTFLPILTNLLICFWHGSCFARTCDTYIYPEYLLNICHMLTTC